MKFLYMNSPQVIFQINGPVLALPKAIKVWELGQSFAEPPFQTEAASADELTFLQIAYLRDNSVLGTIMFHPVAFAGTGPDRLKGINQFGYGLGQPAPLGAGVEVVDKTGISTLVGRLTDKTSFLQKKFDAKPVVGNSRFIRVAFPRSPLHVWLDMDGIKISPQPEKPEPLPALATIIQFPGKARAETPPTPA